MQRNLGIIADGGTDHEIFQKIAECVLLGEEYLESTTYLNVVPLIRRSLRDHIDRYWIEASKLNQYFLPSTPAKTLQDHVFYTLNGAFKDLLSSVTITSNRDIILLTSDAEKTITHKAIYLNEAWAFSISKILMGAIERFYDYQITFNYLKYADIPVIIPLVTFPSTEILVAAAKNLSQIHDKSAKELKRMLYGTDNLSSIRPENLKENTLEFITPQSIESIFKKVPDAQLFIQNLSLGNFIRMLN